MKTNNIQHIDTSVLNDKETPGIIIKEEIKCLFSILHLHVISADSIIITATLINTSNTALSFYKPLLPIDNLSENVFTINIIDYPRTFQNVKFLGKPSMNYYIGNPNELFAIKPQIKDENIMTLNPNRIFTFTFNVARFYDFHMPLTQNKNNFEISYNVYMPYIVNYKHVLERDSIDKKIKPAYFIISTNKNRNHTEEKLKFSIKK